MNVLGESHRVVANGTEIAWSECGQGRPLVLLHGLGDTHRTWRRVVEPLSRCFRVLMPDLPGHGCSGHPDAPYTVPWYAQTMLAWMDAVGIASAHVCGHSYGGGVAQWMLIEQRARIQRLALVAPGGFGPEVGLGLRLAATPVLGPKLVPWFLGVGTRSMLRVAASAFAYPEPEEVEFLARINESREAGLAFQKTVAACIDLFGQYLQTWEHIGALATLPPLAVFWGERDAIIPIGHGQSARKRLQNARFTAYRGCGHFPHLEAHQRFARDLSSFLTGGRARPVLVRALSDAGDRPRDRWGIQRAMAVLRESLRPPVVVTESCV